MEQPPKGYETALTRPCPECGGGRVLAKGTGYTVVVPLKKRLFDAGSPVLAVVCRDCGYTAFFVEDIDRVL